MALHASCVCGSLVPSVRECLDDTAPCCWPMQLSDSHSLCWSSTASTHRHHQHQQQQHQHQQQHHQRQQQRQEQQSEAPQHARLQCPLADAHTVAQQRCSKDLVELL